MNRGTLSLLFGAHQILKHPLLVALAWRILYRRWPSWRQAVCIVIHDWGYWGCSTMDGHDGTAHPTWAARLAGRILGPEWDLFVAGHSRHWAKIRGIPLSPLFAADKLGTTLEPWWSYLPFAVLTGEVGEYIEAHGHTGQFCSRRAWYGWVCGRMIRQACEYMTDRPQEIVNRTRIRNGDT